MKKSVKEYILKITKSLKNENSKINSLLPFFILLLFVLLNTLIAFKFYVKDKKNSEVTRLHVVANSNSINDKIVKLKVNERITEYISNLNIENLTNEEIMRIIKEKIGDILNISNEVIANNNLSYTASANIGKIHYEKKESILLNMDEGNYNSIQIILGDGNGENIWTLISPSKDNLKSISALNTIMPGIDKLYENNNFENTKEKEKENQNENDKIYKFKIIEFLNKF